MTPKVFTPGMKVGELCDSDFDKLAKEIAERAKNLVFMTADKNSKAILNEIKNMKLEAKRTFTLNFEVTLFHNDIIEILGGFRRK